MMMPKLPSSNKTEDETSKNNNNETNCAMRHGKKCDSTKGNVASTYVTFNVVCVNSRVLASDRRHTRVSLVS